MADRRRVRSTETTLMRRCHSRANAPVRGRDCRPPSPAGWPDWKLVSLPASRRLEAIGALFGVIQSPRLDAVPARSDVLTSDEAVSSIAATTRRTAPTVFQSLGSCRSGSKPDGDRSTRPTSTSRFRPRRSSRPTWPCAYKANRITCAWALLVWTKGVDAGPNRACASGARSGAGSFRSTHGPAGTLPSSRPTSIRGSTPVPRRHEGALRRTSAACLPHPRITESLRLFPAA